MRIGVGLPNTVPGVPGRRLVEWARQAEALGFSSLMTIGRLVFPTHDELIALTAAAAVTDRVGLMANTLIEPAYDPIGVARQAASLDQISEGRFVLGLAVGWRQTDFEVAGRSWSDRGARMDADIELMQRIWRGEKVNGADKVLSPRPTNGEAVPLAFGGNVAAAFRRTAQHGVGWTAGGSPPDEVRDLAGKAKEAWAAAGRDGQPRIWALVYFGLGPDALANGERYLSDYYGDWGPGMAAGMPKDAEAIAATVRAYAAVGVDELLFVPTDGEMNQLDLLISATGGTTA
jgi:alkanesulfonate monooxygenase SsuD/methylene tetrahydromethanopterin reductase-like flavin-dependent oxidoreductase (luciferase family)